VVQLSALTGSIAMQTHVDDEARPVGFQPQTVDKVAPRLSQFGRTSCHQSVTAGQTTDAHVQTLSVTAG